MWTWVRRELQRAGWRKVAIVSIAIVVVVLIAYGNNYNLLNGGN